MAARVFDSVLPLVAGAAYFLCGAAAQRALMGTAARLTYKQEALEGQLRWGSGCVCMHDRKEVGEHESGPTLLARMGCATDHTYTSFKGCGFNGCVWERTQDEVQLTYK
eukprot:1010057-Pelagomonas_calceolata.AAC.1